MSKVWTGLDVIDTDNRFVVDAFTREITSKNPQKTVLIHNDHNSERFTFEIPRFIEGRDVGKCNVVQVCYSNGRSTGVYTVDDMAVYPFVNDVLTCSWLISQNATKKVGILSFMLRFAQVNDDATVEYAWSTKAYSKVVVAESIDAVEEFEDEYVDVIKQWENDMQSHLEGYVERTVSSQVDVAQITTNKNDINALEDTLEDKVKALKTADAALAKDTQALNTRMDAFTSLTEGSTTGDAELIDIRTDFMGVTTSSAGSAVRQSASTLDDVKQRRYGSFSAVDLTLHNDVVYNVDEKTELSIDQGYYAEYEITDEKMLLLSGCGWSSYTVYPLGAFYDSAGVLLQKVGVAFGTFDKLLCYVPAGADRLVINGKEWYEPEVYTFAEGDLETDIADLQQGLAAQIDSTKLKSYEEVGVLTESIVLSETNTELLEGQMYDYEGKLVTGVLETDTYDTIYYPVGTYKSFLLENYAIGVYGGAFLDINKKFISTFKTDYPNNLEEKTVPANAHYIAITVHDNARYKTITGYRTSYSLSGLQVTAKNVLNQWSGKKIVWIGTSVSFGQYAETSYPYEASKLLGFELVNCSVPGVAIHTAADGSTLTYGSLSLTKAEYEAQNWTMPDAPIEYNPGGSYNNYYRTYENVFSETNADADLYVFDVAPNNSNFDTKDWDAFDFDNWAYTDGSNFSEHRTTFLGALLFLMDKMYASNENARMIFVLGSGFAYGNAKTALQKVSDKWNIPIVDLWSKINISPKSIAKIYSENGTNAHPSTFAHEIMGKMISNELMLIG